MFTTHTGYLPVVDYVANADDEDLEGMTIEERNAWLDDFHADLADYQRVMDLAEIDRAELYRAEDYAAELVAA